MGTNSKVKKITLLESIKWSFILLALGVLASFFLCWHSIGGKAIPDSLPGKVKFEMGHLCHSNGKCEVAALIRGPIASDFLDQFAEAVNASNASNKEVNWLCFDSQGGSPWVSVLTAYALKDAGINSCIVPVKDSAGALHDTRCASACMDLFLAGNRKIINPTSGLGVHRSYIGLTPECRVCNWLSAWLFHGLRLAFSLVDETGNVKRLVFDREMEVPSETVHWVTKQEFIEWRLGGAGDFDSGWYFIEDSARKN